MKFTAECEEDYADGKIPTLDTCIWVEKTQKKDQTQTRRRYQYWGKPMTGDKVLMEKRAISWNAKRAAMESEVMRRLLNTDEKTEQKTEDDIVNKFDQKLINSG